MSVDGPARRRRTSRSGAPPSRTSREDVPAASAAHIRRLLVVVAALVLVLLVAEATDTLIGNAGLLAFLTIVAGLCVYVGFFLHRPLFANSRRRARTGFVITLLMIGVAGYFGFREKRSMAELARLIDPVPDVTDVTYIPTGPELAAVSAALSSFADGRARPADFTGMTRRFWKLETTLLPAEVMAFYGVEANRGAWSVVAQDEQVLQLRRGPEGMTVFLVDDWDPGTSVWYIAEAAGGP